MAKVSLPEILTMPPKLLPLVTEFNNYRYVCLEGGRGSGKSWAIARFILYLGSLKTLRILCLREIQDSIEQSVYQLLVDTIQKFQLNYDVTKAQITHRETGSTIRFKGLRDQGAVNIKSAESVDIVFVEEAQSITKASLDILIPTIRKEDAKIFFAMNRYIRRDPVYDFCSTRKNALIIHIDYFENQFCPKALIYEAEECKERSPKDYKHIWLGQPLAKTTEYLFNFDKLTKARKVEPFGDLLYKQRVMGVDFASGGGDLCVASLIERRSNVHWKLIDQIAWDNPDTDASVGKTIQLFGQWNPDLMVCDKGGLGYPMFVSCSKVIKQIIGFDGSETDKCTDPTSYNNRYQAYLDLNTWIDKEWINISSNFTIKEMETIKKKYLRSGKMLLQDKREARKEGIPSQDRGDSVSMCVFGAVHFLGKVDFYSLEKPIGMRIIKKNTRKPIG